MTDEKKYPVFLNALKFNSKDKYLSFVKDSQNKGHMKKCAHISFHEYRPQYNDEQYTYAPKCNQNSFDIREDRYQKFYGCPKNCTLYESRCWGKTKKLTYNFYKNLKYEFFKFFRWFSSISIIPQIIVFAFILCLIGYISMPFLNKILEVFKVLKPCL